MKVALIGLGALGIEIGGVLLGVLGARKAIFAQTAGIERAFTLNDDGNGDDAGGDGSRRG